MLLAVYVPLKSDAPYNLPVPGTRSFTYKIVELPHESVPTLLPWRKDV